MDDTEPAHDTFAPEEQAEINLDKDADGDDNDDVHFLFFSGQWSIYGKSIWIYVDFYQEGFTCQ